MWRTLVTWVVAVLLAKESIAMPEIIKLGALFSDTADSEILAFLRSIEMVNDDRTILTRSLVKDALSTYPRDDSLKASRKLCELIQPGVAAIFGPTTPISANHVQSLSGALHIPFIETRWDYDFKRADYSISIRPNPVVMGRAYADFIKQVGWTSLVIVYENEESLVGLQELLRLPKTFGANDLKVILKRLEEHSTDYRPMLKTIKLAGETHIVLDCNFDRIQMILEQAKEIEMLTEYHTYFITSIDVDKINMGRFVKDNVNITGFRLVDPQTTNAKKYLKKFPNRSQGKAHPLYSSNALMYDAVQVLAKALNDLSSLEDIQMDPLSCQAANSWHDGDRVLRYLKEVEYMGLTGEVRFDLHGFRTEFHLDLVEKYNGRMKKVANWDTEIGLNYTLTTTDRGNMMVEKLANKTMRVVTALNAPFVMERKLGPEVSEEAKARYTFEEKYHGFCIDLIKALAKEVKFKFTFELEPEGTYGKIDKNTGKWTGMIKMLRSQQADMAVIDMSITAERVSAVSFTIPYMNTGVGILYKKTKAEAPNLFSFIEPFSVDVWIYMTTAYLGASLTMFLLARLTPFEWENPHPCIEEPEELENELTLHNCFWHNWGSLMQQGSDIAPKAISTRMVAGMWWFFTLIMVSSYTANLAAFLTASKMSSPINSAEDLARQTKIKYGTYCCGSTRGFFSGSSISTYRQIDAFMESTKPSVMTKSNQEGLNRVLKEDGMYAFFMEAAAIEYNVERFCDLKQLGGLLDSKGYGIALPKDSPYTSQISEGVLALQEKGVLKKLKEDWWKVSDDSKKCPPSDANSAQMDLAKLGGVFIVVFLGMIFAIFIALFEFAFLRRRLIVDENESLLHEMWTDLKFAVNWRAGDTKPIKVASSSRIGSRSILSKSNASLQKYGVVGEDQKSSKSRKDSNYACFDEIAYGEKP